MTGQPQGRTANAEEGQMKRGAGIAVTTVVALATGLGSGTAAAEAPNAGAPSSVSSQTTTTAGSPAARPSGAAAKVIFGFEKGTQGWGIPDWALEKPDMVGKEVLVAKEGATEGSQALAIVVDFPGGKWNGAIVEDEEYFDWSPYSTLSVDVTLPAEAPAGLKAKLVLTVGENWEWTEMRRSIQLPPGQTTTITASLAAGSEDWKRTVVDENFRKDVRKLAIRLESNKPAYQGKFYIDNVRLE